MKEEEKLVEIPIWLLKRFANTLRMTSNALDSSKRKSCLDRNIMLDWNVIEDLISGRIATAKENLDYYLKSGQTPTTTK